MLARKLLFQAIVGFCFVFCIEAKADTGSDNNTALKIATLFCQSEFDGAQSIRQDIVYWTPARKKSEEKRDPEFGGGVNDWYASPVVIVKSFKIKDIVLKGDKGNAVVIYERLARSEGEGLNKQKLVQDKRKEETVNLQLSFRKGMWLIVDPPIPHVSKEAMLDYHERHLKGAEESLGYAETVEAKKVQKRNFDYIKQRLDFIRQL